MRELTGGTDRVAMSASTVRQVVEALEQQFPGIRERLCVRDELSPALQVSIDGVMSTRGLNAKLKPSSEVHFVPAIGGG
jgi:molybdopterin synthase sulfur carrier subunit